MTPEHITIHGAESVSDACLTRSRQDGAFGVRTHSKGMGSPKSPSSDLMLHSQLVPVRSGSSESSC